MPLRPTSRSSTSVSRVSGQDIRHERLLSKILVRIVSELKNKGVDPTADMMDEARHRVQSEWSGAMSERQIKGIANEVFHRFTRAKTSLEKPIAATDPSQRAATPPPSASEAGFSPAPNDSAQGSEIRNLLRNTTRRERQALADAEWIALAEADRVAGIEGKKQDRRENMIAKLGQRRLFDAQIDEHKKAAEEEHQRQLALQREMDEHIENHRYLTKKERQDAFDKAMREKKFREQQQQLAERNREEARTKEHNEQVRHCMLVREELEKARQDEIQKRRSEREEWKHVLQENQARLTQKAETKEKERALDREFQKNYAEELDRRERERAETLARKAARSQYFQKLADGVASKFLRKEQDLSSKIEAEYNQQIQRAMDDERERKSRQKARMEDCQANIKSQIREHEAEKRREKDDAKRQAEALAAQIAEAKHQEECRRVATKQEAKRLKEFLATQLQMQHFREARPLETSITRPMSRASTMFSPSRYQPSPKPDDILSPTPGAA